MSRNKSLIIKKIGHKKNTNLENREQKIVDLYIIKL